jgi:hypothetical protein
MAVLTLMSPRTRDILLCGLVGFCLPAYAAFVKGFPEPTIHDEFSYLLAADTFARGRLTNPSPPLPAFFEAPHILVEPSYQSKYPPGTGLVLAVGQVLLGHPRWGAWFLSGCYAAALCWMLQAFTRRRWALAVALCATVSVVPRFGAAYLSTMLAGASAATLFGSLQRIFRRPNLFSTTILSFGVIGLAVSRPFEGVTVCLGAAPAFLSWLLADRCSWFDRRMKAVVLPGSMFLAVGGVMLGCYNQAVTGHWSRLPYSLHHEQYFHHGLFVFNKDGTPRLPREPGRVANIYRHFKIQRELKIEKSQPLAVAAALQGIARSRIALNAGLGLFEASHFGLMWIVPALLLGLRGRAIIFAPSFLLVCIGHSLTTWYDPSYSIVIFPWLAIVLAENLRLVARGAHVRRSLWLHPGFILLLGLSLAVGPDSGAFVRRTLGWVSADASTGDPSASQETAVTSRAELRHFLSRQTGTHLVFVRYEDGYNIHNEWVYNEADLDGTRILFAHDLGEEKNRQLTNLQPQRQCWRMEVGNERSRLLRLSN